MLDVIQFRDLVVRPALQHIGHYSIAAERLVIGTAVQESGLFSLKQGNNGPALGLFQIEPSTHLDIWDTYLAYRSDLASKVRTLASQRWYNTADPYRYDNDQHGELIGNLPYSTAICRVKYLRVKEPIPNEDDLWGLAGYWKTYYNTAKGKGRVEEFYSKFPSELIDAR